ncbi:MAG: DNA internalization-related competence protein ComEC/Rec2 [Bacteroidota bacterium]
MIRFVIFFIIGILVQYLFELPFVVLSISAGVTLLLVLGFYFYKTSLKLVLTILVALMIVLVGSLYYSSRTLTKTEYPFDKTKLSKSLVYGKIKSISLKHEEKFSMIIAVDSMNRKGNSYLLKENFLCNVKEKNPRSLNKLYNKISIGNSIRIKGTINRPRGERNPGEFDYAKYLQTKDISAIIYAGAANKVKISDDETDAFFNSIYIARKEISNSIETIYNERTSGLLKGLLLADRGEIDYRIKESFINSGVIHVLAVSGLHVGFIVVIFLFLFSRTNIYTRSILTIVGLILFLLITNYPPSVFRATIMAVVMILVFLSNRNYNAINSLAIAALILLIMDPSELFNPGFQLSFSAVLSILILFPLLQKWIIDLNISNSYLKYLLLFIGVSFSAQLGTLPFTLIYFHKLSIVSLFANILVIPMIGIIISLGIVSLTVGAVWTWGALMFSSANMLVVDILFTVVDYFGQLKISHLFIEGFSVLDGVLFYIFFLIFLWSLKRFTDGYAILVLSIILVGNSIIYLQLDDKELLPDGKLSLMMIDIGQGDGILIKFPNGKYGLVDAGNATPTFDNGERVIAPLLKRLGIDNIDYGFVSHMDSDHYKGFVYLISSGYIAKVYKPRLDTSLSKDIKFEKLISENNVDLEYYSKRFIDFGNSRMYILNDTTNSTYNSFDTNNKSGVFKIVHGKNTMLLVGDAEKRAEKLLLKSYSTFLDVDLLKVGHHGSKTSSSETFLEYVKPELALVSAGLDNKFKHPSPVVIDRYNKRNVKIHRTDLEGAIVFQSDGKNITKIDWKDF